MTLSACSSAVLGVPSRPACMHAAALTWVPDEQHACGLDGHWAANHPTGTGLQAEVSEA